MKHDERSLFRSTGSAGGWMREWTKAGARPEVPRQSVKTGWRPAKPK